MTFYNLLEKALKCADDRAINFVMAMIKDMKIDEMPLEKMSALTTFLHDMKETPELQTQKQFFELVKTVGNTIVGIEQIKTDHYHLEERQLLIDKLSQAVDAVDAMFI